MHILLTCLIDEVSQMSEESACTLGIPELEKIKCLEIRFE